jgi:Uma2 family endonuclease
MSQGGCGKMMNAMGTPTTLMTFEQFERLPDEPHKLELIDGELIRMPPAITRHMRITMRLYNILYGALGTLHGQGQARDLGEVFHETGYLIGANWLIPDLSITHAGQTENKYLEGAPALAVEVISKANTAEMMQRKVRLYMEGGAREAWLFYPRAASVIVYRGRKATEVEGKLTSELLPGLSIDLSEVYFSTQGK